MKDRKFVLVAFLLICLVVNGLCVASWQNEVFATGGYTRTIQPLDDEQSIRQVYDAGGYVLEITKSGQYYFELHGEQGTDRSSYTIANEDNGEVYTCGRGGRGAILGGYIDLKKGDNVYIDVGNYFAGGATQGYTLNDTWGMAGRGGDAVTVKINGTDDASVAMVAAGGGGGAGVSSQYVGKGANSYVVGYNGGDGSASDILIKGDSFARNNRIGGGGAGAHGSRVRKNDGVTIDPGGNGLAGGPDGTGGAGGASYCGPKPDNKYYIGASTGGQGGKSFLNKKMVQSEVYQANASTGKSVKISLVKMGGSEAVDMNLLSEPIITVAQGVPFQTFITCYDDITSGIAGNVTFTNTDKTDGIVEVSGCVTTVGRFKVVKDEREIWINVIPEPKASNVSITFD